MGVYGVIDSSHCNVVKKSGTQRSLECKVGQTNDEVVTAVYQYYLNDDETKSKPILLYWDYKIGYDNRQFWEQITFDRAQYENNKETKVKTKVCSNRLEYQQSIVERIKELPKGPTAAPSDAPSGTPSAQLSRTPEPTQFPTFSAAPSVVPTSTPTVAPSDAPSGTPSTPEPTQFPTFHPLQRFLNPHRQRRMNAATRSTHFPCQMEAREDARLLPTLVRGERPCAPKPTKRNARVYVGSLIINAGAKTTSSNLSL